MAHKILHILVNYKNDEQTKNFLKQLMSLPDSQNVLFCLVNNSAKASDDPSFFGFEKNPHFRLINAPENLGYFGAAQMAYLRFRSEFSDWCLVSNTDMSIDDQNFYQKIINYPSSEKLAVLAPAIVSEITRKDSNPFMRFRPQQERMHFYALIFSNYLTCQLYQILAYAKDRLKSLRGDEKTGESASSDEIYAAQGAFFIFNQNFFSKGEDLSHPCFLYGEEIVVAEKCRRQNLEIRYEPALRVFHHEHGAIGLKDLFLSKSIFHFRKQSSRRIYDLFFSN